MDIKSLLEGDGFTCKYIAKTYGGTYSSPCPWCGGTDRFRCFPNNDRDFHYLCQQCCRKGNVLRYLTEYRGLDYSTANLMTDSTKIFKSNNLRSRLLKKDIPFKDKDEIPCQLWQKQASRAINNAMVTIWYQENKHHVKWLNERGITDETIKKHKLGFNTADTFYDKTDWGLIGVDNNSSTKMIFPEGIVIPHVEGNVIQKIKIRRSAPIARNKYHLVAGSNNSVMMLGTGKYHIVVESELDGILIEQEAGDLVTVVVLGSAQNRPDSVVMAKLRDSRLVLLALDNDKAGVQSSYKWWMRMVPAAKRWPVLKGKDPGESFQNGVSIRDWVIAGILKYFPGETSIISNNPDVSACSEEISADKIEQKLQILTSFKTRPAIFIDVITTGDDPLRDEISEIHLSDSSDTILRVKGDGVFSSAISELKELFSQDNCKIFYGAKSQLKFLRRHDVTVNGTIFDQMLAQQLLYTGTEEVSNREDIGQMKRTNKSIIKELQMNALDAVVKLEMDCIPVIVEMELNGMLIDKSATDCLLSDLQEKLVPIQSKLHDFFCDINLKSDKQLLGACNQKGIQIVGTKKHILLPLVKDYPILKQLIEYRSISVHMNKLEEILSYINPTTGRVHPVYNQIVDTGRMSCSHPNIHGIPKQEKFRKLFIAAEGSRIIRADFSQIELRVAAEISGDPVMIKAFNEDQDLHTLTASLIMSKPVQDISGSERQCAKALNFGMLFGMGATSLQEYAFNTYGVTLSVENAEQFIRTFCLSYKDLSRWQQQQQGKTETRTLSNRRRIWKDNAVTLPQLLNSPIQGTAADILKKSLVLLSERLIGKGAKIIGTIHDEILVESRSETARSTALVVEHTMIEAGEFYLRSVRVKVDVTASDTWQ
jgi:DNA polymerase I